MNEYNKAMAKLESTMRRLAEAARRTEKAMKRS